MSGSRSTAGPFSVFFYNGILLLGLLSPWGALAGETGATLTLKAAETTALTHDKSIRAAETGRAVFEFRQRQHYGRLLPSLSFSTAVSAAGKAPGEKNFSSGLQASLKVPDPLSYQNEGERVSLLGEKASLETQLATDALLYQVRKQYYQILFMQQKISLKEDFLVILQRVFEDTRKRYYAGLIHKLDFRKAELSLTEAKEELAAQKLSLNQELSALWQLLGSQGPEAGLPSGIFLSDTARLTGFLSSGLFKDLREKNPPVLEKNAMLLREAGLEAEAASYFYMPAFSLSADRPTDKRAGEGMTYSAGLTWEFFSGGKDYYLYREKVALQQQQSFLNDSLKRDWFIKFDALRHRLGQSLSDLRFQFNVVKSWEEIISLSAGRFSQGLAEYRELSDDLEKFSRQKEKLTDLQSGLWNDLIELSRHCGDSGLFYTASSMTSERPDH